MSEPNLRQERRVECLVGLARKHCDQGLYFGNGHVTRATDAELVSFALAAHRMLLDEAPRAIMDTRTALGLCAPTEEDFPSLYALQGKHVRLVVDEPTECYWCDGNGHQREQGGDARCNPCDGTGFERPNANSPAKSAE